MKNKELKVKTDQELELSLKEFREKLRKLNFDLAEKKLKNVGEISESRKTIARILTLFRQRAKEGQVLLRKNASEGQAILNNQHGEK